MANKKHGSRSRALTEKLSVEERTLVAMYHYLSRSRAAADTLAALAVAGGLDSLKNDSLETMLIHLHEHLEQAYQMFGDIELVTHH